MRTLVWRRSILSALVLSTFATRATSAPVAYVAGPATNSVYIIDADYGVIKKTTTGFSSPRGTWTVPSTGKTYVANYGTSTVSAVEAASGAIAFSFSTASGPGALAVDPTNARLYVANETNLSISEYDISDPNDSTPPQSIPIVSLPAVPNDIALSSDGSKLYIALANGTVRVYDAVSPHALLSTITLGGSPVRLTLSPDGGRLFVANSSSCIWIVDTSSLGASCLFTSFSSWDTVLSPDGNHAFVAYGSNKLGSYDVTPGSTVTFLGSVTVGNGPRGVGITPDGSHVYVTNADSGAGNTVSVVSVGNPASISLESTISVGAGSVGPIGLGHFLDDGEVVCTHAACALKDLICLGSTQYGLSGTSSLPWSAANLNGCTIADVCPCMQPVGQVYWESASDYKNCVKTAADQFATLGLITNANATTIKGGINSTTCGN